MSIHWTAVQRENYFVLSKVSVRGLSLNILEMEEFTLLGDKDKQVNQLKELLRKYKIKDKYLKLAISCPGVVTRMITLPQLSGKDLEKLLTEQVDQYFTINTEDYLIDYRLVDQFEENEQQFFRVLLAAIPRFQWESIWNIWDEAGIRLKSVDLAVDSMSRLYTRLLGMKNKTKKGREPEKMSNSGDLPDIAIIDINSDRVEIVLLERGAFFLYSDVMVKFDGNIEPNELILSEQSNTDEIFGSVLLSLSDFFNFFAARHFGKSIDQIYLTGSLADLPGIQKIFENNLGIETFQGFPGDWRPNFNRIKPKEQEWMKYGSLFGLAF